MDSQRNILLIALALVSFLLFQQWQVAKNPAPQATQQAQSTGAAPAPSFSDELDPTPAQNVAAKAKTITVSTDVLTLSIDTLGGDVVSAKLNQYSEELNSPESFVLLQNTQGHQFIAQSGLVGPQGIDVTSNNRPAYQVSADSFTLAEGQDELRIPMTYQANGIDYTKTFILKRGSYAVDVVFDVANNSGSEATLGMYAHLRQNLLDSGGNLAMPTYRGGAYSTSDVRYKKYSFDDMKDRNLSAPNDVTVNWVAMIQHYFASAWIPRDEPQAQLYSRVINNLGDMGIRTPNKTIANGDKAEFEATLWVGPKLQDQMATTAPNLDLVVDYGWLWFIAKPLHWLLSVIQNFVGNWGVAIICLTFIVRGAMYPLTKAQYTSMAKMRMLQPKLQAMRERIGDDRQRMSQEMMELYKKEKVNPLGGCLPILLQMPIFIALYWALMESVELRHSPFFGWIHDLSAQDPYYILPLLMGASMFVIQKMSPTTITDPMQQKIMTFMPVMFTFFFLWFPSGLVLYWLVSNIVTLIQQTLIYKALEKKGLHSK
ncbi:TPA: membrane protein insertase YidC [Vibrio cholerae]|uniref:membrane protein insertase YidC n=1 Tax=Vibrio cholerae TaxID=666 RepID=UPI00166698E3|nr:membrane protein insertase YidC [Vibrio cholerae]EJX7572258.1 membrane protein insertase YidC [Vibrio cholerae]MBD1178134.1 membrane protein insertase YidC [Vibrio cholerae]MDQ4622101.1 membrane protein insertase YidC [Vibrio cholerae]MDQ4695161.1 membrane protein insertase YidC [Vibrio cholerae]HDZ3694651.1 membrane protein insertase YidC [Vibrio cholerae]